MERNQSFGPGKPACETGQGAPPLRSSNTGTAASGSSIAGSPAGSATAVAEPAVERAKESARSTGERLKEGSREAMHQAEEAATNAARQLREQGETLLGRQRERLAEEISHFSAAFRQAADKFEEENDSTVASCTRMLADQTDGAADFIRHATPGNLLSSADSLARRHPEVFFGGMFIAGLALARFLKASNPRREYEASYTPGGGGSAAPQSRPMYGAGWESSPSEDLTLPTQRELAMNRQTPPATSGSGTASGTSVGARPGGAQMGSSSSAGTIGSITSTPQGDRQPQQKSPATPAVEGGACSTGMPNSEQSQTKGPGSARP